MFSDALPEQRLKVAVGQHSDRGRKAVNQDFYGWRAPAEPLLSSKGIAIALADGINSQLEIDYHALEIERGDVFVLATDGVYEHVDAAFVAGAIRDARGNLDDAARAIVAEAYRRGSTDNLTVQIVCVEDLPEEG